ncbi:hypothetical protein BDV41DRAFT_516496 [Aspergillus transmontanensis]|uniref:Uncharacterized protein n=1 Tax=Aspergillus transmontanensis TaxID=1034304 RepID=A0A5N6WGN2_9EURO|nr:hypothetical protein BDV41DRAFT_516496 [Aspergillus transmontanensis]
MQSRYWVLVLSSKIIYFVCSYSSLSHHPNFPMYRKSSDPAVSPYMNVHTRLYNICFLFHAISFHRSANSLLT